jgi:Tfp pilus assembly protein PilF
MKMSWTVAIGMALLAPLISGSPAPAQDRSEPQLGTVHFPTSCNQVAQQRFDRATLYQHSFWYRRSKETFEQALEADPQCLIAYWGVALSLLWNPHVPPPRENLALGLAALQKAATLPGGTPRERDYIQALLAFYTDHDTVAHGVRVQRYLQATEALAQRHPGDDEAQIAYAITLNVAASPSDKTYANQLKGAAILEPIFKRQPRHPGVAHYLIHLYDYPPIAARGLEAAQRYADIAPDSPHALHMPSHIFTRVGYWKESVATNAASARAAKVGKEPHDQLHAMDYMVYGHLQLAQDAEARAAVEEMVDVTGYTPNLRTGFYAVAASQARYMIERGDWAGAATLRPRESRFAYVDAITYFARALGAARSGNAAAARADMTKLAELRDALQKAGDRYWTEQVDIQWQITNAWALRAEGKPDEALAALSAAADAEDQTEKSIVTPGPLAPARELYGAMLLDRGRAKEALVAFESALGKEPNRYHGLAGAARAAEALGDKAKARTYYEKLLALTSGGNASRPELVAARRVLAGQ